MLCELPISDVTTTLRILARSLGRLLARVVTTVGSSFEQCANAWQAVVIAVRHMSRRKARGVAWATRGNGAPDANDKFRTIVRWKGGRSAAAFFYGLRPTKSWPRFSIFEEFGLDVRSCPARSISLSGSTIRANLNQKGWNHS